MQNTIKKSMSFKFSFEAILIDFRRGNGGMLAPKSNQNRCQLRKADFAKGIETHTHTKFNNFSSFGGRSWHQNSIKHRPKIEARDDLPLSIDIWLILTGFCRQFGSKNQAKSVNKSIEKRIDKMIKQTVHHARLQSGGALDADGRGRRGAEFWTP